jgi:putative flippase GtrA
MRDGAHLALERARNPTRDEVFRFAAVGIAAIVALIGLLAVLTTTLLGDVVRTL